MRKQIRLVLLVFIISSIIDQTYAQSKNDKSKDAEKFNKAIRMSEEAKIAWNKDEIAIAEKLFMESSKTYLTDKGLNQLANLKVEIGDIKGSNAAWNLMLKEATNYNEVLTSQGGGHRYKPIKSFIIPFLQEQGEFNAKKGDIHQAYKAYLAYENYIGNAKEFGDNYYTLSIYACQTGNLSVAQRAIDSLKVFYGNKENAKKNLGKTILKHTIFGASAIVPSALKKNDSDMQLQMLVAEINLFMAKGEYEKAIEVCDRLEKEDNGLNTTWKGIARLCKAECFTALGNRDKAKESLDMALKHVAYSKTSPNVRYVTGLINLMDKDFNEAVKNFTEEMNYKTAMSFIALNKYTAWGKYRYFSKRAEAYVGLKDFVKARKDYEAALLYNPDYEPAINGLARLEGRIITERKTDKNAPVIHLTEPSVSRGLKVTTSGLDIMVKGMAKDPSGLQSVTINGLVVYSKEEGDFWGAVQLKEGMNKLLIIATDVAGNAAEQTFEIDKQATPIATANDIVPVKEREGRNFAVLIASQNYDDSAIPSLDNPIADAVRLKLILKNSYNFLDENLVTLFNPDRSDFKKKFLGLSEVIQPEDNLVIFYAGHGIWVDKEKKGYWLLSDAKRNDVNTWLPNKEVLDMIAELPARHTLLITDACFSGSVFKSRGLGADAPVAMKEMDNKITRVAITSGNDTEVPDVSVFMKYLVKALSENKEKYLTAQKMFITQIIEAVMTESKTEPRYGTLELAGHVGGDFIFSKK
jgi:tetratricopeptide (TPR) repeat protein